MLDRYLSVKIIKIIIETIVTLSHEIRYKFKENIWNAKRARPHTYTGTVNIFLLEDMLFVVVTSEPHTLPMH